MRLLLVFALLLALPAQASQWAWFEACKHKTGEPVGMIQHDGFATHGHAYVDTDMISTVIPLEDVNCVLLQFRTGGQITVLGSKHEVWCKVRGGPGCGGKE